VAQGRSSNALRRLRGINEWVTEIRLPDLPRAGGDDGAHVPVGLG
jgi:hypothetical protein